MRYFNSPTRLMSTEYSNCGMYVQYQIYDVDSVSVFSPKYKFSDRTFENILVAFDEITEEEFKEHVLKHLLLAGSIPSGVM